jgi:autotransporter translocation and assembly factor TamB
MAQVARRSRRWWRWPVYLGLALLLLLALLFVALRTSFAREQVRTQVSSALAQLFRGQIQLDRIGEVTLWGVRDVDARIFDPQKRQVIRVQGLSARASLPSLGWQLLVHSDQPAIDLADVHIDFADVALREDEELGVTLASTFLSRKEQEATTATAPGASSAGPRLHIARVTFERIWVHGRVSGSPYLDADLTKLLASLRQSGTDGFGLDLDSVELTTRALPLGADPRGHVSGVIEVPAGDTGPMRLEGTLDGSAAGSPLALEVSWVGDYVHAAVSLLRVPAGFVQQASGLELDGDMSLVADVDGPLPQLDFQAEMLGAGAKIEAAGYAVVAQGRELAASIDASGIDLGRAIAAAPQSELHTHVNALLFETDEGQLVGSHRIDVERGRVARLVTPALWLTGKDRIDDQTGVSSSGKFGMTDPGASLLGAYAISLPTRGRDSVKLSLASKLEDPERLTALGICAAGKASLSAELWPTERTLTGTAALSLRHLDYAVVQARNVEAQARVSGSLSDPHLLAAASADLLSGRAHADLDYASNAQQLDLFATDLDLVRLSHVAGLKLPIKQGKIAIDAHVGRRSRAANYELDGAANADLGPLGSLQVVAKKFELPGGAPSLASVGTLQGELTASGKIELEALSGLLTEARVPLERTTGHVRFEVSAKHERSDPRGLQLALQLDTNGLRIVERRDAPTTIATTSDAIATKPLALEGIDLHLAAHTWPSSGEAVGTLILRDAGGTLAEAQAEVQLAQIWAGGLLNVAALSAVPLKVSLQVPLRKLQSLPPLVRPAALRGRFSLDAMLEGSAADPRVKAQITVESLRAAGSKQSLDVKADVSYARSGGEARVVADGSSSHVEVANLTTTWQGDLRRAGELATGASGITASGDAKLRDFPLDVVPLLLDREIRGRVSGDVTLKGWGRDASLDASLASSSLMLGQTSIQELDLSARTAAGKLSAELSMKAGAGTSKASVDADMHWGKLPLPALEHRGTAKLATAGFRLETLSPLLSAYVSEIGGVLDANTELTVTPSTTTLSGSAKLEKGVVQVPAIGQRFSDITARFAVANDQFKLEQLEARGTTGRISVKGAAHLDGFELRAADAQISIKNHESLPITLEGADIGEAWGNVNARYASPARGEKKLDIDVPEFHLVTPESSGYTLQDLDAPKDVRIGVRRADGAFAALPVQPLQPGDKPGSAAAEPAQPLRIQIKLGNNVTVERGRTAQAQLTGQLTIVSASKMDVNGRIEVRGGKLDVSGKTFEIERGVVTFQGDDPGNPSIAATARWDAPGYAVYADYVGDVQNGRIKLHSEPPLTQDELASLLLFGSPEGSASGGADPNAAALAVSVAGDTAAKGLTKVLDDFTKLDVSARVDTTTGTARPELVLQVSPRVSAKVTRAIGAPAAGESPDRTFLTLELRLKRAWALSAVLGDHGASALDLIWRRRY